MIDSDYILQLMFGNQLEAEVIRMIIWLDSVLSWVQMVMHSYLYLYLYLYLSLSLCSTLSSLSNHILPFVSQSNIGFVIRSLFFPIFPKTHDCNYQTLLAPVTLKLMILQIWILKKINIYNNANVLLQQIQQLCFHLFQLKVADANH